MPAMTEQRSRGVPVWLVAGTLLQIGAFFLTQSGRDSLETVGTLALVLGTALVAVGLWMALRRSDLSLAWCLVCFVPLVALWTAFYWIPKSLSEDDDAAV
jgi:hypothetical protein